MDDFFSERSIKATRKVHHCEGCGRSIEIRLPAQYGSGKQDGEFIAFYWHVECRAAEIAWNSERGSWGDEFDSLYMLKEDDEADDWVAWLIEHHPIAASRLGLPE